MSHLLKIYSLLTHAQRRSAIFILALTVVGMFLETLGIGLVIPALAFITDSEFTTKYPAVFGPLLSFLGNPSQTRLVIYGLIFLAAVYIFKTLFLVFLTWRQALFTFGVQENLSQRLFSGYLQQPYAFHLQHNSALLIRNVVNETNQFSLGVMIPGMTMLTEIFVLLGIGGLLLWANLLGALLVIVTLGVVGYSFHVLTKEKILRWGEARQLHDGLRIQHLQQGLGGAKDVKLLGREEDFLTQYSVHNSGSARVGELQTFLQALPRLWLELLAVISLLVLVFVMLLQGKVLESLIPMMGLFAAAAFRLMPSVNRLINTIQSLRFSLPVLNVIHSELNELKEPEVVVRGVPLPFKSSLELRQISYTYPNSSVPALTNINMTISKGASVGIIGGSGEGKSTLIDVILGLLTPQAGQILLDGVDVQTNMSGWQQQIGYVPQNIYLTDDTLRRNIAFGLASDKIDDVAVQNAIKAAQLDEFVATLPGGVETMVGERGVRISGGQCQRIGIARALYHDPEVLMFDEATSALDNATEKEIMSAIKGLRLRGKTILIVAHRLSTIEYCDSIIKIQQGRISEQVKPSDVFDKKSAVAGL